MNSGHGCAAWMNGIGAGHASTNKIGKVQPFGHTDAYSGLSDVTVDGEERRRTTSTQKVWQLTDVC